MNVKVSVKVQANKKGNIYINIFGLHKVNKFSEGNRKNNCCLKYNNTTQKLSSTKMTSKYRWLGKMQLKKLNKYGINLGFKGRLNYKNTVHQANRLYKDNCC